MPNMALPEVSCWGSGFHGVHVAQTYGMTWRPTRPTPYRYVVAAGNFQNWTQAFASGHKRIVCHWIGYSYHEPYISEKAIHWADDEEIAEILKKRHGIDATVLRHQPRHWRDAPLPEQKDGILVYRAGKYHDTSTALEVERLTGRKIYPLGVPDPGRSIADVFEMCCHYIRMVPGPDGFSHLAAEMIMAGGGVITNKDRPHQAKVKLNDVDAIVSELNWLPDERAAAEYAEMTHRKHVYNAWRGLL